MKPVTRVATTTTITFDTSDGLPLVDLLGALQEAASKMRGPVPVVPVVDVKVDSYSEYGQPHSSVTFTVREEEA